MKTFCKFCKEIIDHIDIGVDREQWKCVECGEYNIVNPGNKGVTPAQFDEVCRFLEKESYLDADYYAEKPTAAEKFFNQS